jgi:hypothetical protein
MSDLAAMAERLRVVKRSYQHFLALWAVDRLLNMPVAVDRFHADIEQAIEDPHNHDWKVLYRGSVLDD